MKNNQLHYAIFNKSKEITDRIYSEIKGAHAFEQFYLKLLDETLTETVNTSYFEILVEANIMLMWLLFPYLPEDTSKRVFKVNLKELSDLINKYSSEYLFERYYKKCMNLIRKDIEVKKDITHLFETMLNIRYYQVYKKCKNYFDFKYNGGPLDIFKYRDPQNLLMGFSFIITELIEPRKRTPNEKITEIVASLGTFEISPWAITTLKTFERILNA